MSDKQQKILPEDLVDLSTLAARGLLRIELSYAKPDNLLFGERIYRPDAALFLYKTLADCVEKAAQLALMSGYRLIVYDGLRTTDAQARMLETRAVRDNPHWLEEPRLLSPPGAGGHPRAMAVDCSLETDAGVLLDMGTPFDFLAENPGAETNPAHRNHPKLSPEVRQNRMLLDMFMLKGAQMAGIELFPLPQEWWDYRLPKEVYEKFAPLADADLPSHMRLMDA